MKMKKKKKKISTSVTEEPKTTHLVVSQSHLPFCNFSFSIVVASRPETQPPKNLSLRLSVVMETSQVSVLPAVDPAVHCGICGSVLKSVLSVGPNVARPSAKPTNQPTSAVYCLCERSLGTFACPPAQKTSKSPRYCSVPTVCMYVCGGLCVCYLTTIIRCGKEKKTRRTQAKTQQIWWAEEATSHLQSFYAIDHIWKNRSMRRAKEGLTHKWKKKVTNHCLSHQSYFGS